MWKFRRAPLPAVERVQICPPARVRAGTWRQRLLEWLAGSWPVDERSAEPDPPSDTLDGVQLDFIAALDGIDTPRAAALAGRIRDARSLRDLWHLRVEVFDLVSHDAGQGEATARLARINRHFPTRSPRSGFVGFDVTGGPRNDR